MGSELIRRGQLLPSYIWSADSNINNPDLVLQIHKDYIESGSRFITTNTFRTTPRAYRKTGLSQSKAITMAQKSLKTAVKLASQAAGEGVKILGSIAPLEDCYKPELFPGYEIAKNEYRQIGKCLLNEGIDIFLIETMNSISETKSCLDAISIFNHPIWVSFILINSNKILSGENLVDAIQMLQNYEIDCMLLNCNPLDRTLDSMKLLTSNWEGSWGIYPNLGVGEPSPDGDVKKIHSNKKFINVIDNSIKLGANFLGTCCGSNINHIKLIAKHIEQQQF